MPNRPRERGDGDSAPARPHGGAAPDVASSQEAIADKALYGRASEDGGARPRAAATDPVAARAFVDGLAGHPRSVAGRSPEEIAEQFNAAGFPAVVERTHRRGTSGNAVQVRVTGHPEITNVQVHPGGGRHTPEGSPYWKISTNTAGRTWVIPGDFRGVEQLSGNVVRYDE